MTTHLLTVGQRWLLHEAYDLHACHEPVSTEEEGDAEDYDSQDEAALAVGMVSWRYLPVFKLDVSWVLGALHFEGMLIKFELFLRESCLHRCITFVGDPHVVWSVDLIHVLVLNILHFFLNRAQFLEIDSPKSICTLLKFVKNA